MMFFADTHVHLYPCYDLGIVFKSAFENLKRISGMSAGGSGGNAAFGIFLAERGGCSFFSQLKSGSLRLSVKEYVVENCSERDAVLIKNRDGMGLHVFAGRQIVTGERLEVQALMSDLRIPDGGPIEDVIRQVIAGGGIPVIPWSPGKWFGDRGKIISALLTSHPSGQLMVADTSMRPSIWFMPLLMRKAARMGFKILAGTDPFPFEGQETLIGKYGITIDADFNPRKPVSELRQLLRRSGTVVRRVGTRDSLFSIMQRFRANRQGTTG